MDKKDEIIAAYVEWAAELKRLIDARDEANRLAMAAFEYAISEPERSRRERELWPLVITKVFPDISPEERERLLREGP